SSQRSTAPRAAPRLIAITENNKEGEGDMNGFPKRPSHDRRNNGRCHGRASSKRHLSQVFLLMRSRRSRLALATTVMDDNDIAAPASTGFIRMPKTGYRIPAAIGMPSVL